MAVYTVLEAAEVEAFLRGYGVEGLRSLTPIGAGVENTNYCVEAGPAGKPARYVVTLFERDPAARVAETVALTSELAARGVPCPTALRRPDNGRAVGVLRGRPAVVAPFVEGRSVRVPTPAHLDGVGRALAALHRAGSGLVFERAGAHLASVLCPLARELAGLVRADHPELAELLLREAEAQERVPEAGLPCGVVHADLFFDNVLFTDGDGVPEVKALLDFHLAGRGPWLFDLAVALVDGAWAGGGVSGDLARSLLAAYRAVRPLEPDEVQSLPAYLRRAALRFLCLRVQRFVVEGRPLAAGAEKDPGEMVRRLRVLRGEEKLE